MLKSKKMMLVGTAALLALILSVGIVNASGWGSVLGKYLAGDEVALQNDLTSWSNEQLIEEIDTLAASMTPSATLTKESPSIGNDINVLIPFASELFARKDQFNDTEILSVIADNTKTVITREVFVDLYALKHEVSEDGEEIKQFLRHDGIDPQVKSRIVSVANFTTEDIALLKSLVQEDDGVLAFNSLKRLSRINTSEAFGISEGILANLENESSDKISAALKATAKYLKNEDRSSVLRDKNLESDFIDLSFKIIKSSDDPILRDSAFFAVSEIGSENAITRIIESESIETLLKVYAVDQNFITLKEILTNNPTENEIETVTTALELLPIVDLIEPLEEASLGISDPVLKQRIANVVLLAEKEGVKGNYKWVN